MAPSTVVIVVDDSVVIQTDQNTKRSGLVHVYQILNLLQSLPLTLRRVRRSVSQMAFIT